MLKGTIKGDATTYTYNLNVSSTSSNSKNDCLELAILKITGKISLVIYKSVISNRIVYPDFISKQKTLELSQSGIAFLMGWNLAKS